MLVRLALVSSASEAFTKTAERLRALPDVQLACFAELDGLKRALESRGAFDAIVLRVERFDLGRLELAARLRAHFPSQQILFLFEAAAPEALLALRGIAGCAAVNEAREFDDIVKVAKRLAARLPTGPRAHARARRQGAMELRTQAGEKGRGTFVDFGPMGARARVERGGWAKGDRITLLYASSAEPSRVHRIVAAVMWTKPAQSRVESWLAGQRPKDYVGLRFIAIA